MPGKKSKQLDEMQTRGCEILKGSKEALSELRSLAPSAIILLLTPVMYTAGQSDPFEPLGRAISKYHARVRHVPYIAKIGLTDTHQAFMQQANVIMMASIDDLSSSVKLETPDKADSVFEFVAEASSVPVVHFQFGSASTRPNDASHEVCIRASHATPEMFSWAACLLFGRDE